LIIVGDFLKKSKNNCYHKKKQLKNKIFYKYKMEEKVIPKVVPFRRKHRRTKEYICKCCDYYTQLKSDYTKHLKTKKHIKKKSSQKNHPISKMSSQKSSLKKPENEPPKTFSKIYEKETELKELCQQQFEAISQLTTLVGVLVEKGSSTTNNTNNTNCNNTNINNTIAVNVYLNDHCKDALNIKEFVDQIKVELEDILHPSKLLKDNIVPTIFMNNLNKLSNEERPVHCADARRGKFFVKNNDKWSEIKKEDPLNPLNSQIGMLKYEVYKKAQDAEEEGLINWDKTQKIRKACEISPTPTTVDNKIISKIATECSLLEARKKRA